ncbi:hypothetical protein QQ045_010759 [Rhodiola kirilowii]
MSAPEAAICYVGVAKQDGRKVKGLFTRHIRVKNKKDTVGVELEKPNPWAFDTTQFDNILKRLKVSAPLYEKEARKQLAAAGVVVHNNDYDRDPTDYDRDPTDYDRDVTDYDRDATDYDRDATNYKYPV